MEKIAYNTNGDEILLGDKIGSGVESIIYELNNSEVAKVYKEDDTGNRRLQKLNCLLSKNLSFKGICFPKQLLFDKSGLVVGYIMDRAVLNKDMQLQKTVFNPNLLKSKFPSWTRLNLIQLSISILEKVQYLHDNNILLGDWNPLNILVKSDSEIYFVDTDSYQIDEFTCPVGSTLFTPPELQDAGNFDTYLRTKQHELFSLATLLFMIFLPGKSPYAFQGGGEIKDNIKLMNFSYPLGDEDNYLVPQGMWELIWNELSYDMRRSFYSVFKENERLNIEDWVNVLNTFKIDIESGDYPLNIFPDASEKVSIEGSLNMNLKNITDKDENLRKGKTDLKIRSKGENIGILELSTKAVKFLTADQTLVLDNGFNFDYFFRQADKTETGRGLDKKNNMDLSYFDNQVLPSIRKMIRFARDRKIDTLYSVATAAYRSANNREQVVDRIRETCGINVKILKKSEEALATLTAFIFSRSKDLKINPTENIVMIDQGGGSTEISLFKGQELLDTYSLNLGTTVLKTVLLKESNKNTSLRKAFKDSDKLIKDRLRTYYSSPKSKLFIRNKANYLVANGTAVTEASGKKGNAQQHCTKMTLDYLENIVFKYENSLLERYSTTDELMHDLEGTRSSQRDTLDRYVVCRLGIPMFLEIMKGFSIDQIIINGTGLWYGIYFQNLYKLNN